MKRLIFCLVMACVLALPGISSAQTGVYLAPKFLMTFQNTGHVEQPDSYDDLLDSYSQFTLGGALAVGYDFYQQFNFPLRVEVELALRGNSRTNWNSPEVYWAGDLEDGSGWQEDFAEGASVDMTFNSTTLLANFYYDFRNSTAFTPYVGAGIGVAFNYFGLDVHNTTTGGALSLDKHQTNLAWQVGAGVAYNFTDNIAVDLAYRYLNLGYIEVTKEGESIGIMPYNHEILLGLRVGF